MSESAETIAQVVTQVLEQYEPDQMRDAFRADPRGWLAYTGLSDGLEPVAVDTVVALILEAWEGPQ